MKGYNQFFSDFLCELLSIDEHNVVLKQWQGLGTRFTGMHTRMEGAVKCT